MSQVFEQEYSAGFYVPENYAFKSEKGLNRKIVEQISEMKGEPEWMRKFRLKSLELFEKRPMPTWGADLSSINFLSVSRVRPGTTSPARLRIRSIAWAFRRRSRNISPV